MGSHVEAKYQRGINFNHNLMKQVLIISFILLSVSKTFSQNDSIKAKFNGECLISGGSISLADYTKLHSLCLPKLTKVIRYKFRHQTKGTHKKDAYPVYIETNMDFQLTAKKVNAGDIIMFDEITGLGMDKKKTTADPLILFIK